MKNVIFLLFVGLLASCSTTIKSTTCVTKSPNVKKSAKMAIDEPIDSIDQHEIKIQYVVMDKVHPLDTAEVESYLIQSHNNLNWLFRKGFVFEMMPEIWYSYVDMNVDDANNRSDLFQIAMDNIGREEGIVYVYVVGNTRNTLLGFTVVFPSCKECYSKLAPKYDFIVLSRESITNPNTLAHETGHFFGLPHTFEIKEKYLASYGLQDDRVRCINKMGYVCCAYDTTGEQVGIMWNYCAINRHNLIWNQTIYP